MSGLRLSRRHWSKINVCLLCLEIPPARSSPGGRQHTAARRAGRPPAGPHSVPHATLPKALEGRSRLVDDVKGSGPELSRPTLFRARPTSVEAIPKESPTKPLESKTVVFDLDSSLRCLRALARSFERPPGRVTAGLSDQPPDCSAARRSDWPCRPPDRPGDCLA